MRRLALLVAVVGLVGGALATANAATTRTVCHRTSSAKNPYVKLRVSAKQLRAHLRHAADIVPAPGGRCPRSLLSAAAGGRAFPIALTGEAESPAGDPVATATATVRLRAGQGQLCYQVATKDLPAAAAMHIHKGDTGAAGPVVVPLRTPDAAGTSSGCAPAARTLVSAILGDPGSYYLNVHTAEFPAGAVRGQLTGTSTASFGWVVARRPEGHQRAQRDRHRGRPHPEGRRLGLLSAPRGQRHAADDRRTHPPRGCCSERARRRSLHRPRGGRKLERLRHRVPLDADRRDHRQPGGFLRQRAHHRAPSGSHPRPTRLTSHPWGRTPAAPRPPGSASSLVGLVRSAAPTAERTWDHRPPAT